MSRICSVFFLATIMAMVHGICDAQDNRLNTKIELKASIAADFPKGIDTVLSGRISHALNDAPKLLQLFEPDSDRKVMAQQDEHGSYLFFHRLDESPAAERQLEFAAEPASRDLDSGISIVENDAGYEFREGDRIVLNYQQYPKTYTFKKKGTYTRANYVHPVYGLDGEVLTQEFPSDHRHHHGVFCAWHQLWVGDLRAGDPWTTEDFLCVVTDARVVDQGPVFGTLRITADWTSPRVVDVDGNHQPILHEETTIRLFHSTTDAQYVDFAIRLRPLLPDVKIGGAENVKEYSGFTVRVKPPEAMQIVDQQGLLADDGLSRVSPWADVSGRHAGRDSVSGIAILSHPSLAEFPPRWLLRYYGMQNVIFPGRNPLTLSAEQPLQLRLRLVIHRGDSRMANIAGHQRSFEAAR